ncbi:MAG TPA: phosphate ABC transporter substrate-binding protein PstS [Rhodanobacteraceae bacterium]|nr:phosphate ABC transporter substrate-binding protein PstS [Rhodanobacteraceae bacterium]
MGSKRIGFIARAAVLAAIATAGAAHATDITGAGSTFVYPVLAKWSAAYSEKTGNRVNYQSIGSGAGIAQIKAGTLDFGASDKPLAADELKQSGLGQFPLVIGGIVPVANVEGVRAGQLKLDGATLARIFLGEISNWNDPAIAALNSGLKLPNARITVVHRSDGSGTTFNFTNYLSKISPTWKAKAGEGTAVNWPSGIGGKGNEGVAAFVKQIRGSIGYVEYAYALQNGMAYAQLKNAAGQYVQPDAQSFAAAADTADWSRAQDFNLIMTNAPGEQAWPITATTWAILYEQPKDAQRSKTAFDFFKWSLENGQTQAQSLDYVPLPKSLVERIESYWQTQFEQ